MHLCLLSIAGDRANKVFKTSTPPKLKSEVPFLYFTHGPILKRKLMDEDNYHKTSTSNIEEVFKFEQSIVEMDVFVARKFLLALGDDRRTLFKFNLQNNTVLKIDAPIKNVTKIAIDWLFDFVYITSKPGRMTSLYRCNLGKLSFIVLYSTLLDEV